ncbi:hypothetical protein LPJ63_004446 [Coemansia sp. RSA 2711]|nr:hypothetical protein LPJ63_004446 [Coemansia sp. RSA 2711]KAJ2307450.1 hypothetical protein IWW52_006053 [Coemansia sp. RSA 2704]KAJ2713380.1 hypothetical protein H4R23_005976 [Coemansia sp. Cherry 401B]
MDPQTLGTNGTYLLVVPGAGEADTPYMQYAPSRNIAFGIGAVFAALTLSLLVMQVLARAHQFSSGCLASACLVASQFMRGSLGARPAQVALYQAALALNTGGAALLLLLALLLLAEWMSFIGVGRGGTFLVRLLAAVVAGGAVALQCVGVALAFDGDATRRHLGHVLMVSAAAALLGGSALGLAATAWQTARRARQMAIESVGLALPLAFLAVWASYSLAQAKLPLQSTANRSELAYYLLNALPAGLVLLVWIAINAPRLFGFSRIRSQKPQPAKLGSHYEYPSLPPDHDYSYPMRVKPDLHQLSAQEAARYPHRSSNFHLSSDKLS